MKKLLLLIAITGLLFSCTSNEKKETTVVTNPVPTEVSDTLLPKLIDDELFMPYDESAKGLKRGRPKVVTKTTSDTPLPVYPVPAKVYPSVNKHVLLLDFNGDTGTYGAWNNGQSIVSAPCSLSLPQIDSVLNAVRQRFYPYDILVTTSEIEFYKVPATSRQRVVISPTSSWYPNYVSGIAYNGSFFWGDGTPVFVFSDRLFEDSKYITEIITHEAGHGLTLTHHSVFYPDCSLQYTYKPGDIMGNSLSTIPHGIFGEGQTYCNTTIDDRVILAQQLGYRVL